MYENESMNVACCDVLIPAEGYRDRLAIFCILHADITIRIAAPHRIDIVQIWIHIAGSVDTIIAVAGIDIKVATPI